MAQASHNACIAVAYIPRGPLVALGYIPGLCCGCSAPRQLHEAEIELSYTAHKSARRQQRESAHMWAQGPSTACRGLVHIRTNAGIVLRCMLEPCCGGGAAWQLHVAEVRLRSRLLHHHPHHNRHFGPFLRQCTPETPFIWLQLPSSGY